MARRRGLQDFPSKIEVSRRALRAVGHLPPETMVAPLPGIDHALVRLPLAATGVGAAPLSGLASLTGARCTAENRSSSFICRPDDHERDSTIRVQKQWTAADDHRFADALWSCSVRCCMLTGQLGATSYRFARSCSCNPSLRCLTPPAVCTCLSSPAHWDPTCIIPRDKVLSSDLAPGSSHSSRFISNLLPL